MFEKSLRNAAISGCMNLVFFLKLGTKDVNYGLLMAAYGGHVDIAKLALELEANNIEEVLESAMLKRSTRGSISA